MSLSFAYETRSTQDYVTAENLSTSDILEGWRAQGMTAWKVVAM